ncbi:Uncharacterised protein [Campylobacter sputorum subsp. bubulus]|uniref:Uncharacterized protein n=1 Tax=Campylobacter sputorum subsp. sputorum TaxID=32024 RepID=A0A381DI36_9BACT|nr:hypothetical protein [Campylobacter sputorum]ASM35189.1 hypothetical protein CSPUT_0976 [Campylobacter sputorum aubsp. sputorum RM3237]KAB0581004.1 hypothetical protein F7P64_07755 [Campylobacter sputorum subsp. sputorum]QEL05378.1 hypothetical protein CSPT_0973 [Campylobacter sputorum subsp. sputorum]SUX08813.1 Uncharacterised protein [Campylobacter sputorum subsp. bubulus]SUX10034.1 Uncharacterised protein [Campylobacter sputorum subsp. sputorum]
MVVVKYTNKGGVKVFKNVPDKDVFKFFKDTAGVKEMPKIEKVFDKKTGKFVGNRYTIHNKQGKFNLRDFSKSNLQDGSKPKWTMDFKPNKSSPEMKDFMRKYEFKFE